MAKTFLVAFRPTNGVGCEPRHRDDSRGWTLSRVALARPTGFGTVGQALLALAIVAASPGSSFGQDAPLLVADLANPADLALVTASGGEVRGKIIRNTCGDPVHPRIGMPAPGIAVVIEADPTGRCSGSNPPSTLTVLAGAGAGWKVQTATPAAGYRLGAAHSGRPDIVAEYPPFDRDCPVLRWDGQRYEMAVPCGRRGATR